MTLPKCPFGGTTMSLGEGGGWKPAGSTTIIGKAHPRLDSCWSACNGLDGFGHADDDKEMLRVRARYGEVLEAWAGYPHLILYRPRRSDEIHVSVWCTHHVEYANVITDLALLAKACAAVQDPEPHVELIDWDANRPEAKGLKENDSRYELSISFNGLYDDMPWIKSGYRAFMKIFLESREKA